MREENGTLLEEMGTLRGENATLRGEIGMLREENGTLRRRVQHSVQQATSGVSMQSAVCVIT